MRAMSYEGPPNSFRASLGREAGASPVVTAKKARADRAADGLTAVAVSRSESRRGNHRGGDRHRLTDEQATVRIGRKTHKVELVNLSRGGAMIEGKFKAQLWDRLDLELGAGSAVECVVRWVRGNRLGLEFAHETRIECDPETMNRVLCDVIRNSFPEHEEQLGAQAAEAAPKPARPMQERSAVRHPLIWSGILHHDYEWEPVRLRNVSETGALVECSAEFPVGACVHLDLGSAGRLAATICWSRGAQTGLAFTQSFDVRKLAKARPEVASADWVMPDYLKPDGKAPVPAVEPWRRATLEELSRSLGG